MKHDKAALVQMQSLPLEAKVRMTMARVRAWYDRWDGEVYLSFSGGKDSTVLKHIIDGMYDDVPSVFIQTGQEYPEVRRFAERQPGVVVRRPVKPFGQVVKEYGFPLVSKEQAQYISEIRTTKSEKLRRLRFEGRGGGDKGNYALSKRWWPLVFSDVPVSHKCCYYLKKQPAAAYEKETGRKPILATMADESQIRFANWVRYGCNAFDAARPRSAPISFWTEQDVLRYVVENDVELPSVYGDVVEENGVLRTTGLPRTGCIACGFGVHLESHPNRFEKLKRTHPNQWNYVINKLGMGHALDMMGVTYGREDTDAQEE